MRIFIGIIGRFCAFMCGILWAVVALTGNGQHPSGLDFAEGFGGLIFLVFSIASLVVEESD